MKWFDVQGTGKLLTYSTLAFGPKGFEGDLPYTIALLDFGDYKVFGRIADGIKESELSIGLGSQSQPACRRTGQLRLSQRLTIFPLTLPLYPSGRGYYR